MSQKLFTAQKIISIIMIILTIGLSSCAQIPANSVNSWNDITPGSTKNDEVRSIMGDYYASDRGDYLIYVDNFNHDTEIWMRNDMVEAVLLSGRHTKSLSIEKILKDYGKPEKVTWADCRRRAFVWAKQGVVVFVTFYNEWSNEITGLENIDVLSILYFEPMATGKFLRTAWPWPRGGINISKVNPCKSPNSHAPDTFPRDPFSWDILLQARSE